MYTRSRLGGTFPRDLCTRYQATIRTTSTASTPTHSGTIHSRREFPGTDQRLAACDVSSIQARNPPICLAGVGGYVELKA